MARALTIGDFSRATHLSVKTLRHYHRVGLLEPASVDPGSGYRYYSQDQIPAAQVIVRLRNLDMPVPAVKAVLAAKGAAARNAIIAAHLDHLETELARTREAVSSLRNLIDRPDTRLPIEHRTVPATPAIGIRDVVDRPDLLPWWQGALGELHAMVRAQRLNPAGPSGGLYASEIFQHDRGEATVFIPVDGAVRPIGRVAPIVVPAAELAVVTHHGSLDGADITYGALGSYVTRYELSVDGPLREYYLRSAQDYHDPGEWQTQIGWPIFRADRADRAAGADRDRGDGTADQAH
jgi:DNA-binding transcriptional MerR regulator